MDFQTAFNMALGVLTFVFGWMLNALFTTLRDLQKSDSDLVDKVNKIEVFVASNYPTRQEFEAKIDAMFEKLDRIEDKLNRKADAETCRARHHQ